MGIGDLLVFLLHVVVAFVVAALLVLVVGAAATLVADEALLEMRGVPVFIGVAASIVVFALLRGRQRPGGVRDWVLVGIGFVALVVAGAVVYRPVVLEDVQASVERALGVWSEADADAVEAFEDAVLDWNEATTSYQRSVSQVLDGDIDAATFQDRARTTEQALEGHVDGMRQAAGSADNNDLTDGLGALANTYAEQLTGLKLVTDGIAQSDFSELERGDAAYKDARRAADEVFEERIRPLLERADVDASTLDSAVSAP